MAGVSACSVPYAPGAEENIRLVSFLAQVHFAEEGDRELDQAKGGMASSVRVRW